MTPPTAAQWRLVVAESYAALYKRQTDRIYPSDQVDYWHREYLTSDDNEVASAAMRTMLAIFARGRYLELRRDDLCKPGADEPFAESYPREELQSDDPLALRRLELKRELDEVDRLIKERDEA